MFSKESNNSVRSSEIIKVQLDTQASNGNGKNYHLMKTAIFPVWVFPLSFSMTFGPELENDQYDSLYQTDPYLPLFHRACTK